MRDCWQREATLWWARVTDSLSDAALRRERVASALAGHTMSAERALQQVLSRHPITPTGPFEERALAEVIIEDPCGTALPLVDRIKLTRHVARLPWPEIAQRLRAVDVCTDAKLDQLLADAGATVHDRLSVFGLARV